MEGTCPMVSRLPPFTEPLDKTQRKAFNNLIAFPPKKTKQREALGHVSAERSTAFNQHDASSFYKSCGLSRHQSGRTTANYQNIDFIPYRDFPCGLMNRLHIFFFFER